MLLHQIAWYCTRFPVTIVPICGIFVSVSTLYTVIGTMLSFVYTTKILGDFAFVRGILSKFSGYNLGWGNSNRWQLIFRQIVNESACARHVEYILSWPTKILQWNVYIWRHRMYTFLLTFCCRKRFVCHWSLLLGTKLKHMLSSRAMLSNCRSVCVCVFPPAGFVYSVDLFLG